MGCRVIKAVDVWPQADTDVSSNPDIHFMRLDFKTTPTHDRGFAIQTMTTILLNIFLALYLIVYKDGSAAMIH